MIGRDGGEGGGGGKPGDTRGLVATLVHDLRNPLAALAGNLELLREEVAGQPLSPTAERCLADCAALVTRALTLVATLGDAGALAAGEVVVRRSPARLAPEVVAAVATVAAAVQSRALAVEQAVPDELTADVDVRLIGRVVQNLLDHAVRTTPRGGRVAIRATRDGAEVILAVGYTGAALTDGDRARLFERDDPGLYFCRLVAEAHGGSIAVVSRAGQPVELVVRLPA